MVKNIVSNLGSTYLSCEDKTTTCFRDVQLSIHVECLRSNQRTNLTDVAYQKALTPRNTFMFVSNDVNNVC